MTAGWPASRSPATRPRRDVQVSPLVPCPPFGSVPRRVSEKNLSVFVGGRTTGRTAPRVRLPPMGLDALATERRLAEVVAAGTTSVAMCASPQVYQIWARRIGAELAR